MVHVLRQDVVQVGAVVPHWSGQMEEELLLTPKEALGERREASEQEGGAAFDSPCGDVGPDPADRLQCGDQREAVAEKVRQQEPAGGCRASAEGHLRTL